MFFDSTSCQLSFYLDGKLMSSSTVPVTCARTHRYGKAVAFSKCWKKGTCTLNRYLLLLVHFVLNVCIRSSTFHLNSYYWWLPKHLFCSWYNNLSIHILSYYKSLLLTSALFLTEFSKDTWPKFKTFQLIMWICIWK